MRSRLKKSPAALAALVVCSSFTLFSVAKNIPGISDAKSSIVTGNRAAMIPDFVGCGPDAADPIMPDSSGSLMVALPGWGNHHFAINNSSKDAQFYFDQGLSLFYGFHIGESQSSFREAARLTPDAPMVYWGIAMANGPYINNTDYDHLDTSVLNGIKKGLGLAKDPLETDLLRSQLTRYTNDASKTKLIRSKDYAEAMRLLHQKYKDNIEVAALYADALMIVNARNWYERDGTPKKGTDEIISLLDSIIAVAPDHPSALHYYVHMVEPSNHAETSLDEADRLMKLMPSVAHMVHMPSHIYVRTGHYAKGIESNKLAIDGYEKYRSTIGNDWDGTRYLYRYHNADMQGANALLMGSYAEAARGFQVNVDKFIASDSSGFANGGFGNFLQFVTAQRYLLDVRFGKWNELLNQKTPISNYPMHLALWKFGQGMAYAKTGRAQKAQEAMRAFNEIYKDKRLSASMGNRATGSEMLLVAKHILSGTIASANGDKKKAIELFQKAVVAEDDLRYGEPEPWRISARHFLGQAQLDAGRFSDAQKTFADDLVDHPANFWACNGLKQLYTIKKDKQSLDQLLADYRIVFEQADVNPAGAIF